MDTTPHRNIRLRTTLEHERERKVIPVDPSPVHPTIKHDTFDGAAPRRVSPDHGVTQDRRLITESIKQHDCGGEVASTGIHGDHLGREEGVGVVSPGGDLRVELPAEVPETCPRQELEEGHVGRGVVMRFEERVD